MEGYAFDAAMRRWANTCDYARSALDNADAFRHEVVLKAARRRGKGKELTEKQYALLGIAWRGSTDMVDQKARLELMSMVTDSAAK